MQNLLQLRYWFNPLPGAWLYLPLRILSALGLLLFLIGLVAWLFAGKNKDNRLIFKLWHKVQFFGLAIGGTVLLLLLSRQAGVYFLGMPILLLLTLLGAVVWLYRIIYYVIKELPEKKKNLAERQLKEKYLPK